MKDYQEFLAQKHVRHLPSGISVAHDDINPAMFAFQNDMVRWCLERGRSCLAANTGLGKTFMELEWAKQIGQRTLLLAPLGVAKQTERESAKFGYDAKYRRDESETGTEQIVITNYERLHLFDASRYGAVVPDEASIMKSFTGATRNMLMDMFAKTPYKLPSTATPSPNDYMELGNLSEFVGAMSRTEMLAMFFTHDGGSTSEWRLKGHCEDKFWDWCATWMCAVQKPSDLGYDDGAYELPALHHIEHVVDSDNTDDTVLFAQEALTLADQRVSKRKSQSKRIDAVAELIASQHDKQWLIWCELNDEGDALTKAINGSVQIAGRHTEEFKEKSMMDFIDGNIQHVVTKSSIFGWGMNLQNCSRQAFSSVTHSFEGKYQAIRRSWRFGQTDEVFIHQFLAEQERAIMRNLKRKEHAAEKQSAAMVAQIQSANGLSKSASTRTQYPTISMEVPKWLNAK